MKGSQVRKIMSGLIMSICCFLLMPKAFMKEVSSMPMRYQIVSVLRGSVPLALKHPSEYCLEDGFLYEAAGWHAGDTKVHSPWLSSEKLLALEGKAVILSGTLKKDLNAILRKKGPCPPHYGEEASMAQMRSDWVGEETGFQIGHSSREKLAGLFYLELAEIKEFDGVAVNFKEQERKWEVTLTNTFGITLKDVEFVAHYEIYRGKPMPRFRTFTQKALAPQEVMKGFFSPDYPKEAEEKKPEIKRTRLESILIKAQGKDLKVMLEIFLPHEKHT